MTVPEPRWLTGQNYHPNAPLRLFCLPYAGGGASVFRRWRQLVPPYIQVCAVELPGRGHRIAEPPYTRLATLVQALADALTSYLDRPFAIFGHSMGGLIAFELVRALRARGAPAPEHLFVSAMSAPGAPSTLPVMRDASDSDVKEVLRTFNGTPSELLDDAEMMALMLPLVRADLSIVETYEFREQRPLDVPITVFGGATDRVVPTSNLSGWREQTSGGVRVRVFPGDHFFLNTAPTEVVDAVVRELGPERFAIPIHGPGSGAWAPS